MHTISLAHPVTGEEAPQFRIVLKGGNQRRLANV